MVSTLFTVPANSGCFAGSPTAICAAWILPSSNATAYFRGPKAGGGGYATAYYSNAESFLEIGEALGKAMLELQQQNTK